MRARKEGPESYCRAEEERGASEGGRPPATRMGERRPLEGPSEGAGAGARGERGPDQKRSSIVICFMSWRRAREEARVSICARGDGHGGGGERLTSCRAERVGQGGRGVLDGQPPARRKGNKLRSRRTVFSTIDVNSSKLILPSLPTGRASARARGSESALAGARWAAGVSLEDGTHPSLSASIIVLSTICWSCAS